MYHCFVRTGWSLSNAGRVGRHWTQAKRLNTHILGLAGTLMQLHSDVIVRIHANATPSESSEGLGTGGVVTLVQEAVGCSLNDPADVVNQHSGNYSDNPQCAGNFHYVACPGLRSSVPQPSMGSSLLPSSPKVGWCVGDVLSKDSCRLLCEAMHQLHGPADFICGSFDWQAKTGQCCLNPPGPARHLRLDSGFTHSVKVADGQQWTCPMATAACSINNTNVACCDYGGSMGDTVVGHDFLLSTSTHADGRRAFTLMNFHSTLSAVPTVIIPSATVNATAEPGKMQLYEVDPASGLEIEAIDDVAVLPGLQIALDVAEARVFLLGKTP